MAPPVLYRVIYGTTSPEPWQQSLTTVRPALLQSYSRHKVRHADYPAIVPHESGSDANPNQPSPSVRGTLVTGLLDEDLRRLDIFEGSQYERLRVRVKALKGQKIGLHDPVDEARLNDFVESEEEAETYVWKDPRSQLEEKEWDFEEFRREKMWAWIGVGKNEAVIVDEGFEDVDRDVRKRESGRNGDPTGGRGFGGHITKELEAERDKGAAV